MSNPWAIKLKKTGFLEKHLETEKSNINQLEEKQFKLRSAIVVNNSKLEEYNKRQSSLAVDAVSGKQEKLSGQK
jgi:hypothetical protein